MGVLGGVLDCAPGCSLSSPSPGGAFFNMEETVSLAK